MEVRFALPQGPIGAVRLTALRAGTSLLCCASFLSAPGWASPVFARTLATQTLATQTLVTQTLLSQVPAGGREGQANGSRPDPATPSAVNPAPPSVRRPNLELGRRGGAVAELQAVLKLLGFYRGEVNGLYNEATSLAVGRFQAAAKLPQTGRVSANTWNALFPVDAPRPAIAAPATVPAAGGTAAAPSRPASPAAPAPAATAPAKPVSPASAPPAAKPAAAESVAAKPADPKPAKPNPYPTLKLGEEGDAVVRLQRQLKKKGFLEGQPDGDFGPMTEEAVEAAQEALGLEVDGVVGPATWQALLK